MYDDRSASTKFYKSWRNDRPSFATGVSLHGHTWESHENLGFLPSAIRKTYVLPYLMRILERRYHEQWKSEIDYELGYWTSPVAPDAARRLESKQIENEGLAPLVSLTDHDEIAACTDIVSLEWTAPYKKALFHIGVHNLPKEHAHRIFEKLKEITALPERPDSLVPILGEISEFPDALVVFNHPFVDQGRIGHAVHESLVDEFLAAHREVIHALEINALQPKSVNRRVVALGESFNMPLVSGGDRHSFEPNGAVNLTDARTFAEFAQEIRHDRKSVILSMPQCRERLAFRYAQNIEAIMAEYPHLEGRRYWHDRVFYKCPDGVVRSLTEMTGRHSRMVKTTNRIVGALGLVNYLTVPIPAVFSRPRYGEGEDGS